MLKRLFYNLKSYSTSILIILIVTPIFLETFGTSIFSSTELKTESRSLYFLSNMIGQITYPMFSSIEGGCIVLPCFEGMSRSQGIYTSCANHKNPLGVTVSCLFLSCVISLFGGILIYSTNTGMFLSRAPRNIVDTMMIATGAVSIAAGTAEFYIPDHKLLTGILISASFIITAISIIILKKTENPKHLITYLLAVIAMCNLFNILFDPSELLRNKLFPFKNSPALSIRTAFDLINTMEFDYKILFKNAINILNLGLYPLISILTSMPYFLKTSGILADFNIELLSQGLSNGLCSMSLFPSCFNCTGSLLFTLCGAKNRHHSIICGISMLSMLFVYQYVAPVIPSFAVSTLSQFIGFSLFLGFSGQTISSTWGDKLMLLIMITAFCIFRLNALYILLFGILFNLFVVLLFSIESKKTVVQQLDGKTIIEVAGNLDFRNVCCLAEIGGIECTEFMFDFTHCSFIDYTANLELEELIKLLKLKNRKIGIVGQPTNFNRNILSFV